MKKIDFPISNMSCSLPRSCRRLSGVMVAALVALLLSGQRPAVAAAGYWHYEGHQVTPTPEEYAAIKPMLGHVLEHRATGGFQAGPGDAKGSVDIFFKTDDVDRVQFLATSTLTFGANANLVTLVPGQKVVFEAGLVVGGNDKSRALPATGSGKIAIDNGEPIVQVAATFGQTANAKGEATIPNGGPGATMVIHVGSYLAHLGAMGPFLHIRYVWVADTPPPTGLGGTPGARPNGSELGVRWDVSESGWTGTWVRRGNSNIFDASWRKGDYTGSSVLTMSLNGSRVHIERRDASNWGGAYVEYDGIIASDGTVSGTSKVPATGASSPFQATIRTSN